MKKMILLPLALTLYISNGCVQLQPRSRDAWDQPKRYRLGSENKPWGQKSAAATMMKGKTPAQAPPQSDRFKPQVPLPDIKPWQEFTSLEGSSVVSLAEQYLGVPYRFGGESPQEGFDCSGLVHHIFLLKGVQLPRLANEQFLYGTPIPRDAVAPGDLVFFSTSGQIVDHVGIYVEADRFIHAPRPGRVVSYAQLSNQYFASRFQGARRIL